MQNADEINKMFRYLVASYIPIHDKRANNLINRLR